ATDGHVELSWDAVPGATSYQVYRATAGGDAAVVGETSTTSFVDVGGVAGTDYAYTVLAVVPGTTTVQSTPVPIHWVPATSQPVVLRFSPDATQVGGQVILSADVQSGDGAGQVAWTLSGPLMTVNAGAAAGTRLAGNPLSWTSSVTFDSSAVPDGAYTLTASVTDGSGNTTVVSRPVTISNARPIAPTGFGAAPVQQGVALTWTQPASGGAALYRLSRDGTPLVELPADSRFFIDTTAAIGAHTYALVLVDRFGLASDAATAGASVTSAPSGGSVSLRVLLPGGQDLAADGLAGGHLLLSAQALPASTTLAFQFAPAGASWSSVPATVACATACTADWSLSGLAPGHYRVRAVVEQADVQLASTEATFVVAALPQLPAPTSVTTTTTSWGVNLHWKPPSGLSPAAYLVSRSMTGGWTAVGISTATNFVDTSAAPGQTYTYRVQAVGSDGTDGDVSPLASIVVPGAHATAGAAAELAAPASVRAVGGLGGVTVLWAGVPSASAYQVERALDPEGPFTTLAVTAGTMYLDQAQRVGGQVYYRVRAIAAGVLGDPSASASALLVPTPQESGSSPVIVAAAAGPVGAPSGEVELGAAQPATVRAGSSLLVNASGASSGVMQAQIEALEGATWHPLAKVMVTATSSGWAASTPLVTSGLAEGAYQLRAVATAADGTVLDTTPVAEVQVIHSAPAPAGLSATIAGASVHIAWTPPASVQPLTYTVYRAVASGGFAVAASGLAAPSFDDRFMGGNLSVSYVVSSADGLGNQSSWSAPATLLTPAAWTDAPPSIQFVLPAGEVIAGGADALLAAAANSAAGLRSVGFSYMPEGGSLWVDIGGSLPSSLGGPSLGNLLDQPVWGGAWKTSSLAPGSYTVRAVATDALGHAAETLRTLAIGDSQPRGPPSAGFNLIATAAVGAVKLSWDSAGTSFLVERSTDGASGIFEPIGITSSTAFVDAHLVPSFAYWYRVVQLAPASALSSSSVVTPLAIPATGTASSDAQLSVSLPAAAASRLSIEVTSAANTPPIPSGMHTLGGAYDINATSLGSGAPVHLLDQAAVLTFTLPAGLTPAEAAGLAVYHWDAALGTWLAEPSTVDLAAGTITATVNHFSTFTVAQTCGADLTGAPTLCITPGEGQVGFTWTYTGTADHYRLYRGTITGNYGDGYLTQLTTTSYTDWNVVWGNTYFYAVTAVSAGVETIKSTEVSGGANVETSTPSITDVQLA
ncbi:MAG TPA: hypothetical protein VKD46_03445, partial [bacterium]|nr:hypothetical protein [bacterium]